MNATAPLAIVILAAGKGTRMKSTLPKVMHPIAGWPMLRHSLETAKSLNPVKTVLVVSPGMEQVQEFAHLISPGIHIAIQKEQRGTGDAVHAAEPALGAHQGNVLILYADSPLITPETLQKLISATATNTVSVLGMRPKKPAHYGRLKLSPDGTLTAIIEYKDASEEEKKIPLVNAGMMAVGNGQLFPFLAKLDNKNAQGEYYLTDLVKIANDAGQTCGVVEGGEDELTGINSRAELARAEYILQHRLRARAMENGVTLIDPETVYFCIDTKLGQDITIQPHVWFGPGVTVEDFVEIRAYSHIEGAFIGKECIIGPFARLRPGAYLSGENKVGNFVEIKNSVFGHGSQASHLSYLGDSKIGRDVNIGAGTVTCNYDGYQKHETKIGDDAFIGSNTSLVAPVEVGQGAMVGAGSTITQNVGQDALAMTRPMHIEKSGWAKQFRAARAKNKKKS